MDCSQSAALTLALWALNQDLHISFVLINIMRFLTSVFALKEPVEDARAQAVLCWRDLRVSSHTHKLSRCATRFDK